MDTAPDPEAPQPQEPSRAAHPGRDDDDAGAAARATARARTGRLLAVGVATTEALVAAGAAVTAVVAALQGGSLVLGVAVAGVAVSVAYLLAEAARGFARGRRWPTGIFVTTQLLVATVALSLGARALTTFADNVRIGTVTVAALALAVAGLVAVSLLSSARRDGVPGTEEDPPVL